MYRQDVEERAECRGAEVFKCGAMSSSLDGLKAGNKPLRVSNHPANHIEAVRRTHLCLARCVLAPVDGDEMGCCGDLYSGSRAWPPTVSVS